MGMFSQKEIILMIGVVSVLLVCISVLAILDIRDYLKSRKGLVKEEFGNEFEEEDTKLEPLEVMEVEDNNQVTLVNEIKENEQEVYLEDMDDESVVISPKVEVKQDTNIFMEEEEEVLTPKVEEAKVEVKAPEVEISEINVPEAKFEVEIPQVEVKEKKRLNAFEELEEIENSLPNKKDDVTNFEAEQERTAIISLDELMQRSNELYNENEIDQYDDGNEPISIDEVIKMFKHDEEPAPVTATVEVKELPKVYEEVVEEKVPYSKKETIPFISSLYGIEKDDNALEFENTATYEKLDRAKYNDFVAQLKEMNENK